MNYCTNYLILKDDRMKTVVTIPARYASRFSILVREWAQELGAQEIQFGFSKYGEMHFCTYFDDYEKREEFCEKVNKAIGDEVEKSKKVEITLFELLRYYEEVYNKITPAINFLKENGVNEESYYTSGVSVISKALKDKTLSNEVKESFIYLIKLLLKDKYYPNAFYDLTID